MQHVIIQDLRPRHSFLKLEHNSDVGQLADATDLFLQLLQLVLLLPNTLWYRK